MFLVIFGCSTLLNTCFEGILNGNILVEEQLFLLPYN